MSTSARQETSKGHDHDDHAAHDHADDSSSHEGHSHGAGATGRQLLIALGLTCSFMFAEVVGGLISNSLALLTDAAHMLTDAASLALAYAAARAALRPATDRLTYGHYRWQVLAAFVNGLALLALSTWIVVEAIDRLRNPPVVMGKMVVGIAIAGLIVNIIAFKVLSSGERSLNIRGALAHVAGDLLGSVAALIAGAVIVWTGWAPADPLLSAAVAILMVRTGWTIARQSAHILLEGAPSNFDSQRMENAIRSAMPEVLDVHHLHAWTLSEAQLVVTLHVVLVPEADGDATIARIQNVLRESAGVTHATIQIERSACDAEVAVCGPR